MELQEFKAKRFTVWLYPHHIEKLKKLGEKRGLKVSDVVKKLIEKAK